MMIQDDQTSSSTHTSQHNIATGAKGIKIKMQCKISLSYLIYV